MLEIKGAKAKALNEKYSFMSKDYGGGLFTIYNNFSYSKSLAFDYCERLRQSLNGYDVRLCGNSCCFSYAFTCEGENGELKLVYITKSNDFICDLQ